MPENPTERANASRRVREKLDRMRSEHIWPNGERYLWTDAFGVVLLVSLYRHGGDEAYLDEAGWVVAEVERVLGRERGVRIGQQPDRDGQYYHYLSMWMYALWCLGRLRPRYHERAVELVHEVHDAFVIPDTGVSWKMKEDLSGPYPGYGLGALDHFDGYVVYRLIDERGLSRQIRDMEALVEKSYRELTITQDLGLGMMLWMTHFFPDEPWARVQRPRSLEVLDRLWVDPPGYFCRQPGYREVKFAFTNYGISIGLQAVGERPDRVRRLNDFFEGYRSGDEYDANPITHVMGCCSHLPGDLLARGGDGEAELRD